MGQTSRPVLQFATSRLESVHSIMIVGKAPRCRQWFPHLLEARIDDQRQHLRPELERLLSR